MACYAPNPPDGLSKECVNVWNGWGRMNDREVAREAAIKGVHVDLAVTFLSLHKKISHSEAKSFLITEVITWARELLERKQIFRATHILKNTKLDPSEEFSNFFCKTTNNDLRNYIGEHLVKIDKLKSPLQKLWNFLRVILENFALISIYALPEDSIECLEKQDNAWKTDIATILFLKTDDERLTPFLNREVLWEHLISKDDLFSIFEWINITYGSQEYQRKIKIKEIPAELGRQFYKFGITRDMLNLTQKIAKSQLRLDRILDEFSQFGIFIDSEKKDFLKILKRWKASESIARLNRILSYKFSTISVDEFMNLLIDYCLRNRHYLVLSECIKQHQITNPTASPHLELIQNCRNLVECFDEKHICDNIVKVVLMISEKPLEYSLQNPVIVLGMILFSADCNFVTLMKNGSSVVIADVVFSNSVRELVERLPILNAIANNLINGPPKISPTISNLIERHMKLKPREIFDFRFSGAKILPNFKSPELVENFAYSKQIDYKFYLKHSRPGAAADLISKDKTLITTPEHLKTIERKVVKLAILNLNRPDITSSCVAFLEMIKVDSLNLRTKIKSAEILLEAGYGYNFAAEVLFNFDNHTDDKQPTLQENVERILIETTTWNDFQSGSSTVQVFRKFEVLVNLSKLNNLPLPESLLKFCAGKNLWLPFLIFAQIHGYPAEQVKALIQFFKTPNMAEHLTHSALNDIHVEEPNIVMKERNIRTSYLSRLGFKRAVYVAGENVSTSSQGPQVTGTSSGESSDQCLIDVSNIKATLLQTLIRCHTSRDPPKALLQACQLYRNPLLAILATSYEPDSLVTNWLTWLAVSCELEQEKTIENYADNANSATSVTNLLIKCLEKRFPHALHESFVIFLPENPLRIFLEFLLLCITFDFKINQMSSKFRKFQAALRMRRDSDAEMKTAHKKGLETSYLQNRMWLESTALRLLSTTIHHICSSLYEQLRLVETLKTINISEYFLPELFMPDFDNVGKILQSLFDGKSRVRLDMVRIFDKATNREAAVNCIDTLVANEEYATALRIAQIKDLPHDFILIKEWKGKFEKRQVTNGTFWLDCDKVLTEHKVTADCVVDFYAECAEKVYDVIEKYTVLRLGSDWAHKFGLTCRYKLEKKMWVAFLNLEDKKKYYKDININSQPYLYSDLLEIIDSVPSHEEPLNKDQMMHVEEIVNHVLENGDFWHGLKLQKMFNTDSSDIKTLILCYNLAEGVILPHQLNPEQRILLSKVCSVGRFSHIRRTFLSARLSSFSAATRSPGSAWSLLAANDAEIGADDTLDLLKLLSDLLQNGKEIGRRIFMTYRISLNVQIPYNIVAATSNCMEILKGALGDNCMNMLDVVHDFIKVYRWNKYEIADFVCEEVVNATLFFVQSTLLTNVLMWNLDLDQSFSTILQLLQDNCSILGNKIYAYAATTHQSQVESNIEFTDTDLSLIIELLIRAHDCFTADCNMEGISIVLKKSKQIISQLLTSQKWKLIVRLLTGIARYTEMNYVFNILMENDQFEFLLRKGSCKDNTLKVALLEYLKKYCPENQELYKIVALHFTLFTEVAMLWEKEARSVIKNLIAISKLEMQNNKLDLDKEPFTLLQNNEGTKICLKKAMENYTHATEFYLQAEKFAKATESVQKAELMAVQMALVNEVSGKCSALCILNLNPRQVSTLIISQLNFEHTVIVTETYDFEVDWAEILYEQYIIRSNWRFFQGFLNRYPLTESLALDLAKKFNEKGIRTEIAIKNMKKIIEFVPSVHVKYQMASDLGFEEWAAQMAASGKLVYLKDTVWKKGYKKSE